MSNEIPRIHPTAVIYPWVKIGKNVTIKPYAVIGGTGFGYNRDSSNALVEWGHKGGVILENNVDIGSCTCVDRAVSTRANTIVGEGSKLDNLVHLGHNVKIGKHCGLASGAVLGGFVELGDYTFVGLHACIKPKVKIGKYCMVGMGAVITNDMPDKVIVIGNPARVHCENVFWRGKV